VRPERFQPVDPALVSEALQALARAWNTGSLEPLLADNFTNRQRLLDTLQEVAPRDARLQILGVQSVVTHDQILQRGEDGAMRRVSTVTAVALTQIEFNDPRTGFQRLQGTNEYTFRVTERLP
jgi:hypothetical protein